MSFCLLYISMAMQSTVPLRSVTLAPIPVTTKQDDSLGERGAVPARNKDEEIGIMLQTKQLESPFSCAEKFAYFHHSF